MTITRKALILATAFAVLLIAVGASGLSNMARLSEALRAQHDLITPVTNASGTLARVATSQLRQVIEFERALRAATGRGHGLDHEERYMAARARFGRLTGEINEAIARGEAETLAAELRPLSSGQRRELSRLRSRLVELMAEQRVFGEQAGAVFTLIDDGAISSAVASADAVTQGAVAFDFELAGMAAGARRHDGVALGRVQRDLEAGRAGIMLLVVFGAAFSVLGWTLFARSVSEQIEEVGRMAEAVAEGKRVAFPRAHTQEAGRLLEAVHLMTTSVDAAEEHRQRRERDLDGALARIADQNRRLHALERELDQARSQAGTSTTGGREIVGPERHRS